MAELNGEETIERFGKEIERLTGKVEKTPQSLKVVDDILVYDLVFQVYYNIGKIYLTPVQMSTDVATANRFLDNMLNDTKQPYQGLEIPPQKLRALNDNDEKFINDVKTFLKPQKLRALQKKNQNDSRLYTAVETELNNLTEKPYLQLILASAIVQYIYTNKQSLGVPEDIQSLYETIWKNKLAKDYTAGTNKEQSMKIIETKFPQYEYLLRYFAQSAAQTPPPSRIKLPSLDQTTSTSNPSPVLFTSTTTPSSPPSSTPPSHTNFIPALLGGASVLLAVVSTVFAN